MYHDTAKSAQMQEKREKKRVFCAWRLARWGGSCYNVGEIVGYGGK